MDQYSLDPKQIENLKVADEILVLPSKGTVAYPYMLVPMVISDARWKGLVDDAVLNQQLIGLVAQPRPDEELTTDNFFEVGTAAQVVRILRLPDDTVHVLLQGVARIEIIEWSQTEPYFKARIIELPDHVQQTTEVEAMTRNLRDVFERVVALTPSLPSELVVTAASIQNPGRLADFLASSTNLTLEEKQELLEIRDVSIRLHRLTALLNRELEVLEIGSRIQASIKEEVEKTQREFYLREQLKAIQRELGGMDERQSEVNELRARIDEAKLPPEAEKEAERETDRLARIPAASPEYGMTRTYLDWLATLPWAKSTQDMLDISRAAEILDEDHYDLAKVKERILEYLAVRKLKEAMKGPILCFVGPPGVGKTSLGQSIARALGRHFIRISLGGVRDEAEIRGHRRTYVGALPGRIIQGIRRAETNNPVFMLDEIDKLSVGFQGDPAAALLEVLDPAQNSTFVDNYLGVPFDLSRVMFIATANVLDTVPPALRDRMEVLTLPGYTETEKLEIAKRFLVPKQLNENGLSEEILQMSDQALMAIIRSYTREAGVRNLEREIASICRKVAKKVAEDPNVRVKLDPDDVSDYLGPRRFRFEVIEKDDEVGVATGLAWTPSGGDVLFVEVSVVPGKGGLTLTGLLGDVMQESAKAALTYARSRASALGIREDFYQKYDIHIHVPAGAIPKDGPSAGVTMATALVSALSKHPVKKEVAMTGEITLRGKVLPVGGIKEKVLAAHRAGVDTVVLPRENDRDLEDIPSQVKQELRFVLVENIDEVLNEALSTQRREEKVKIHLPSTV
ncbi:MAG: endopeptidase La [Chloroflexi bacterium]|nr:endopeptidase La [Chloroflexota bacterium]